MFVLLILMLVSFIGCDQKPQERHYTEVVIESRQNIPMMNNPHAGMDMSAAPLMPTANAAMNDKISWNVPHGWKEEAGGGMRMATFHLLNDPGAIDCSIVSLGGMAGGLEANLMRWMKQIDLNVDEQTLAQFISSAPKVGDQEHATIYDFTQLQNGADPSTKSTIAAMMTLDDATIFVKMTGTVEAIKVNKDSFIALVKSVHLK